MCHTEEPSAAACLRSLHHPGICDMRAPKMRKRPTSCGTGSITVVQASVGHGPRGTSGGRWARTVSSVQCMPGSRILACKAVTTQLGAPHTHHVTLWHDEREAVEHLPQQLPQPLPSVPVQQVQRGDVRVEQGQLDAVQRPDQHEVGEEGRLLQATATDMSWV
jgi:hypothetical protein